MMGFKVFNLIVVALTCVIIGWRSQRWRTFWLIFPLILMADSDLSWFANNMYLLGARWPVWRAIFGPDVTYRVLVSLILTIVCVVLVRCNWTTREEP